MAFWISFDGYVDGFERFCLMDLEVLWMVLACFQHLGSFGRCLADFRCYVGLLGV